MIECACPRSKIAHPFTRSYRESVLTTEGRLNLIQQTDHDYNEQPILLYGLCL